MKIKHRKIIEFVSGIWAVHSEHDCLFLAAKKGESWIEFPIKNDRQRDQKIIMFLRKHPASDWDLYFCPNAFRSSRRQNDQAERTPYAWCDIDEADPEMFNPPPAILWETSPGRFQGIWIFNKTLRPAIAQQISKYFAYEFDGDRNGHTVTKYLRIPFTRNHKREGKPPKVRLIRSDTTPINPRPLIKNAPKEKLTAEPGSGLSFNVNLDRDPKALLQKYRKKIRHRKALFLLRESTVTQRDRSRQIFIMIKAMADACVPWDDIASLIWHSPYFQSKYGYDISALEKEIKRAMQKLETINEQKTKTFEEAAPKIRSRKLG